METADPLLARMLRAIPDESVDFLGQEQSELRSAPQSFFAEKNIRSAGAAADRQVSCSDLPLCELNSNLRSHRFRFGLCETRLFPVRGIDHMSATDDDLVVGRAG